MIAVKAKGLIVFYVNVGQLPPFKAEAFVSRIKDQFVLGSKDLKGRNWELPDDVGVFFVPVRNDKTRLQYINFDKATKGIKKKLQELKEAFADYYNSARCEMITEDEELHKV